MRRTIRTSCNDRTALACAWAISLLMAVDLYVHPLRPDASFAVSMLPLAYGLGRLTLTILAARVEIDANEVVFHSIERVRRRRFSTEAIVRYLPVKGDDWFVVTDEGAVGAPLDDPWDVHAAMVEFAPRKLGAKRFRTRQLPPKEEFVGLPLIELRRPPRSVIIMMVVGLIVAAVLHDVAGIGALIVSVAFFAFRAEARLDITGEGLVLREPFRKRRIAWDEATAIFCENPKGRRSFVVTALGRGIPIPAHIARDLETMRKVLYSLPDRILCVNFDETTLKGYRHRTSEEVGQEGFLPLLTS